MKAFQHKLSDPLPELHDNHIFEEREARRDQWDEQGESVPQDPEYSKEWDAKREHERDLEHESRVDYSSWEIDQPDFE
jgi:hypothetical protein